MADGEVTPGIISRKDAKLSGLKHFYTGVACKRGHLSKRLVSTGQCCTCLYERLVAWRIANPEENRKRDRLFKDRNRERLRASGRKRYAKNPRKFIDKTIRYYKKNFDVVRERRKAHYYKMYENESVRLAARQRTRAWAKANPERAKANARNGKAKRKLAVGTHTADDIVRLYDAQRCRCALCRCKLHDRYHIDHIQPLSKGGSNDKRNLQLLCPRCNLEKGARDPLVYTRSLGLLL